MSDMIKWLVLLAGCVTFVESAFASPLNLKMYGHDVEIAKGADGEEQLLVDKKLLLKDQYVSFDEIVSIGGTSVVIGERSSGGNACEGSRFILKLPVKDPVRIDGPLDSCSLGAVHSDGRQIAVQIAPTPQLEGSRWVWSLESGFGPEEKVAFAVTEGGWLALRRRSIDHPSQIWSFAELRRTIDEGAVTRRTAILRISSGPGTVDYRGNLLIASSCQSHSCDDTGLLVVADITGRRMFVALKNGQDAPIFSPGVGDWPAGSAAELKAFQKRWQH